MMTALLVARNILGRGCYDPWKVNTDAEYHEEGSAPGAGAEGEGATGRLVPRRMASA
jgi:hypothetical protein